MGEKFRFNNFQIVETIYRVKRVSSGANVTDKYAVQTAMNS